MTRSNTENKDRESHGTTRIQHKTIYVRTRIIKKCERLDRKEEGLSAKRGGTQGGLKRELPTPPYSPFSSYELSSFYTSAGRIGRNSLPARSHGSSPYFPRHFILFHLVSISFIICLIYPVPNSCLYLIILSSQFSTLFLFFYFIPTFRFSTYFLSDIFSFSSQIFPYFPYLFQNIFYNSRLCQFGSLASLPFPYFPLILCQAYFMGFPISSVPWEPLSSLPFPNCLLFPSLSPLTQTTNNNCLPPSLVFKA